MAQATPKGTFNYAEDLLSRLIFETFGDQRYTQDSWRRRSGGDHSGCERLRMSPRLKTISTKSLAKFGIDTVAGQLVLASVNQGVDLLADIDTLQIPLNDPMGHRIEAPQTIMLEGARSLSSGRSRAGWTI